MEGNIQTNKLLQQLLKISLADQTLDANKNGEKEAGSVAHEPISAQAQVAHASAQLIQVAHTSSARVTSFVASTKKRKIKIKTLSQRDEDAKRLKSTEDRRQERQDAMDKEIAE